MIITKQLPEFSLVVLGANTNSPEEDLFVIFDETPEMIELSSEVASPCSSEVPVMIFSSLDVFGMAGWFVPFSNMNAGFDEVPGKFFCSLKVSELIYIPSQVPSRSNLSFVPPGVPGGSLETSHLFNSSPEVFWLVGCSLEVLLLTGRSVEALEFSEMNESLEVPGLNDWSIELPGINNRSL